MVLHRALSDALRLNLVTRNVTEQARIPRREHHEMQVLSGEQVRAFLAFMRGDRLYALYLLAFTTGMRAGELLGLCWRYVHLNEGTITIVQAAQRQRKKDAGSTKTQIVFSEVKTASARRTIRLLPPTLEALQVLRTAQKRERLQAGVYWSDRDLVFSNALGDFLQLEHLSRLFQRHLHAAGLPERRFHDIRHTAITLMLEQGISPLLVSAIAGHHSKEFTMQHYGHVTPQMEQHAYERLEAFFGK
jgi:integrase